MSDNRIEEIKARRKPITSGEWRVSEDIDKWHRKVLYVRQPPDAPQFGVCEILGDPDDEEQGKFIRADAAFIAHAPADIDYLLAELARLQAELAMLTVIAEERAQEIYRMQQIMDSRLRHE